MQTKLPSEELLLTDNSLKYLKTTSQWTRFLAILGFIGAGLLLLVGIILIPLGFFIDSPTHTPHLFIFLGLIYLVLAGISFIPTWYLYKFSTNVEKMLTFRINQKVEEAFLYLMKYYRFTGIMVIVILVIYVLVIIIGVVIGMDALPFHHQLK